MAEVKQQPSGWHDESETEVAGREPRGFENKQAPYTLKDKGDEMRAREVIRARRVLVPGGRALDREHLAELIDQGNQTAPANVLRRRLLERVVNQYAAAIILSEGEWKILLNHERGLKPDGSAYVHAEGPQPYYPEIDQWGEDR